MRQDPTVDEVPALAEIERLRVENTQMRRTLDSIAWGKWTPAAEGAQQTIREIEQARKGKFRNWQEVKKLEGEIGRLRRVLTYIIVDSTDLDDAQTVARVALGKERASDADEIERLLRKED